MAWTVEFFSEAARDEMEALPEDIRARFERIVDLIKSKGLSEMREPYVKHLEGKLWEMRMKGKDGIARSIYVTASGQRIVILHSFMKKTQKTPTSALVLARTRAKEVE
ncbi:MAG: type II toxin-antitoxin system RelE/ParE family toxin [Alphaproteobacteria bacterium]|nr:type II toxin-antitoxin system RelE/ParE family toxin [Alphaproteobacteria bacterium]